MADGFYREFGLRTALRMWWYNNVGRHIQNWQARRDGSSVRLGRITPDIYRWACESFEENPPGGAHG